MFTRKIISMLLAVMFISVAAFTPVFADDTPPGGDTGGNDIHPWDINDGGDGNGQDDLQPPSLVAGIYYPGWLGNIVGTTVLVSSTTRTLASEARIDSPGSTKAISRPSQDRNVRR